MPIHLYTRKRKKARTALNYKFIFIIIKYISNIRAFLMSRTNGILRPGLKPQIKKNMILQTLRTNSLVGGLVDGKSVILAKSSGLEAGKCPTSLQLSKVPAVPLGKPILLCLYLPGPGVNCDQQQFKEI